jgi:hypothetical protein
MSFGDGMRFAIAMIFMALVCQVLVFCIFDETGAVMNSNPILHPGPTATFNASGVIFHLNVLGELIPGIFVLAGFIGWFMQALKPGSTQNVQYYSYQQPRGRY